MTRHQAAEREICDADDATYTQLRKLKWGKETNPRRWLALLLLLLLVGHFHLHFPPAANSFILFHPQGVFFFFFCSVCSCRKWVNWAMDTCGMCYSIFIYHQRRVFVRANQLGISGPPDVCLSLGVFLNGKVCWKGNKFREFEFGISEYKQTSKTTELYLKRQTFQTGNVHSTGELARLSFAEQINGKDEEENQKNVVLWPFSTFIIVNKRKELSSGGGWCWWKVRRLKRQFF